MTTFGRTTTCAKNGAKVGFSMLVMNSSQTAEVWVMGVLREFQGQGIGSALLARLEDEARKKGARYIMVKTIGPSQKDPYFLKTFSFYRTQARCASRHLVM
jgi:GNAT superfamily N-acetyltransferase